MTLGLSTAPGRYMGKLNYSFKDSWFLHKMVVSH